MTSAKKKLLSFALIMVFVVLPVVNFTFINKAVADEALRDSQVGMDEIGTVYGTPGGPQDLRITIVRIINVALSFLAIIFFAFILFAGYQWMTAGGNEDQVTKAKKNISNATIGLAIILLSWGISYWLLRRFVAIATNDINYLHPNS